MLSNSEIVDKHICGTDIESDFHQKIMRGDPLRHDLWTEVIIVILEEDNEKLNGLVERGELKWYFIRIVHNLGKSSTSPFYKKYREYKTDKMNIDIRDLFFSDEPRYESLKEPEPSHTQQHSWDKRYEDIVQDIYNDIKYDLHWYDRQLFDLFIEKQNERGPIRRISEDTQIPEQSVGSSIRSTRDRLKKEITLRLKELNN